MSQLLDHYGFIHHPFGRLTPKAAVLRHRGFEEAFQRLRFTVDLDGLAVLIAEPGCGKSVLLSELADQLLAKPQWAVHYLAHTTTGPFGLINVLARSLGLTPARSRSETAHALAHKLLADERRHLLVIDEAHALPDDSLEDLRLLTIADFDRHSPFLLLLAGQPRLDERLQEPTHRALDQRVTTLARLLPLGCEEIPSLRIPSEAGQGFRREGGHRSGMKAATLSDARAATFGWLSEGWPASIGRVAGFRSERATRRAPTLWHPRPSRRRERDAGTETQHEENSGGVAAASGVRFEPAAGRSGVRCREGERSGLPGAGAEGWPAGSGVGELERRGARATTLSAGAATDAARATGGGLGARP